MTEKVVTRFAPSPTGFMHIGGMRTALFAYLWARRNNGTFILRIEDTDRDRHVEGALTHIMESLSWLDLQWDFGPDKPGPFGSCIQSERLDTYREFAQKLIDAGHAYADPYSAEEVEAMRKAAQAEKRPFLFREHRPENPAPWDGKRPLRFKVPEIKRYHWTDAVRGELEAGEEALDDFILIKGDGWPTYNFAHIVDDYHMGVTHILRADEFISSTPRFLSLYDALGIHHPVFVTLPPILRDDRTKKLGKRDGAKDILDYRTDGYLPDAMTNFLALIGWNPGGEDEVFTKSDLVKMFTIEGIQKAGAVVNEEKLNWFNRQHLLKLPAEEFNVAAIAELEKQCGTLPQWSHDRAARVAHTVIRDRVDKMGDVAMLVESGELAYLFGPAQPDPAKIPWKTDASEVTRAHLMKARELIAAMDEGEIHSVDVVKSGIMPTAEAVGKGNFLWPLRYSLSGAEKSPDPFTLIAILGKNEALTRIDAATNLLV